MLHEDQYIERTPDLVARIRKMREVAEKEMNRFTKVTDYDVRRVVGQKPKAAPDAAANVAPTKANKTSSKVPAPPRFSQSAIEFPSSALAGDDDQEDA